MKKLIITAGLLSLLWGNSLKAQQAAKLSEKEKNNTTRKLSFEEANFVGSYYSQKGNNAAVTGGTGSEELTDLGGNLNISFSLLDKQNRKNIFTLEAGIEQYTSASSDQIDPTTISSASSDDVHFYPSVAWTRKSEETGNTIGFNAAYSTEYDYRSIGAGVVFGKAFKESNSELTFKLNVFFDKSKIILPLELRPFGYPTGSEEDSEGIPYKPRNSYNLSLTYSKIINQSMQMLFMIDPAYQEGLLSTPFHRVYFNDNSLRVEKLPGKRLKLPASIRANYFAGDHLILRSFYRLYIDDWGLVAHTASLETAIKVNPFLSIVPHYRFTAQSGIDHFAPYKENLSGSEFYSSDYDLSKFTSQFGGLGFRFATPGGVFGIKAWNSLELRYGYYGRSTGLKAHIVSAAVKFK